MSGRRTRGPVVRSPRNSKMDRIVVHHENNTTEETITTTCPCSSCT